MRNDSDMITYQPDLAMKQDRTVPGVELATQRLGQLMDQLEAEASRLEDRTAAVRLSQPTPALAGSERNPRPPSCDLAGMLHGRADQLQDMLGRLHRINEEIDL
jgi:hypothetical protein